MSPPSPPAPRANRRSYSGTILVSLQKQTVRISSCFSSGQLFLWFQLGKARRRGEPFASPFLAARHTCGVPLIQRGLAHAKKPPDRTPQVINIHGDTDEPLQCSERALPDRRKRGRPPGQGAVAWHAQPPTLAALTEPAMCRRSSFGCVDDVLQDIHSLAQSKIFLAPARADRPAGRYRPARAAADVCAPFAQGRRRRRGRR